MNKHLHFKDILLIHLFSMLIVDLSCKFKFLIPYNGILSTNVQRLIAQNTIGEYPMNLPIAIYIET